MTEFHEVRFPDAIAYGATGRPVWSTTITVLSTGAEQRNQNWVNAPHRWNIATGIKRLADFHQVLRFFQARRGRLHGFRFRDWQDFSSAAAPDVPVTAGDQLIGTGPGPHQLTKLYADAGGGWTPRSTPVASPSCSTAMCGRTTACASRRGMSAPRRSTSPQRRCQCR